MSKSLTSAFAVALSAATILALSAGAADARSFSRNAHVHGPYHGWDRSADISRSPGHARGYRSLQTDSGRGYRSSFDRDCGDGRCSGERHLDTNSGYSRDAHTDCTRGVGCDRGVTWTDPDGDSRGRNVWIGAH
jgi:hypothetical protein